MPCGKYGMTKIIQKPTISVIMLTYNREAIVSRAIDSIINQSFRDFEFIIVNNGSFDRSGVICDAYALKDSRIKVIHQTRESIGHGRNTGLDIAQGKYITFIDDDDIAELDFLSFLYNLMIKNDADLSICGSKDKVFNEKKIMNAEEALIELMWRKRYNMAFPTKLFRHNLIKDLRFPVEGKFDDISLMYKLMAKAQRIAYHGLSKYTFIRHENNHSAWTTDHSKLTSDTLDEYLQSYRTRTEWLSNKFPNSAAIFRYFEWSFMISMVEKINQYQLACNSQLNVMLEQLRSNSDEFVNCEYILDFEIVWMKKYL